LKILAVVSAVLLAVGWFLPNWALFLVTLSVASGLVVLGLMLLMKTGLVSFGQGLFYCLGGYTAGTLAEIYHVKDALLMLGAGAVVGMVAAFLLGFLMANYRAIFFAMLSLAFSMILYGLLSKTSALGSTDGFHVPFQTMAGIDVAGHHRFTVFVAAVVLAFLCSLGLHLYMNSHLGRLSVPVRDNELRVEYMGASVKYVVHVNYIIAGLFAAIGGGLTALTVGHIDPDMAKWTTSGEFVFVAVLGGTSSVLAPFLGALVFELLRSYAYQYSPNTWQLVVGTAMLLVIMFLPMGLWSIFMRRRKAA
jgi:branched-chain amino acid transport system permease protein